MPQPRDQIGDLHPRKLPTFAGLGALRDLNLKLFALVQVLGGDAKPARRDLLDLGGRVVAIGLWVEMRGIFAAFAAVGLRTDPVHRHVQSFVRLRAQRAQRHARRDKALADRGDAFHLFQRHRRAQWLHIHQIAQVDRRIGPHLVRKLLPQLVRRLVARHLQHVHRRRFPSMGLAGFARFIEAADGQNVCAAGPAFGVHFFGLGLQAADADAGNPAEHAGEVFRAHRAA